MRVSMSSDQSVRSGTWCLKQRLAMVLAMGLGIGDRASAEPPEFCIPSLQTLLMMPLSRAGDRFEAAWGKPRGPRGDCACTGVACDSISKAPSYELDETLAWKTPLLRDTPTVRSPSPFQERSNQKPHPIQMDKDEQLALEWNAPVKVDSAKVNSVKRESLASRSSEAGSDKSVASDLEQLAHEPAVQLASGISDSNGVRLTGISQARSQGRGTPARAGLIKDKYSERKRPAQ